jgi:hypothetical protein
MVLGCLPAHARIGEIHNAKPGGCANVSLGSLCNAYGPLGGTHEERISNKEVAVYSRAGGSAPIGNDCHRVHMKNAEKVGWDSWRDLISDKPQFSSGWLTW